MPPICAGVRMTSPDLAMQITRLAIPDVLQLEPRRHHDERGWLCEVWQRTQLESQGIHIDWIQDNQSYSAKAGTLRGLHFQTPPMAQAKLVRCLRGKVFDVSVDLRVGSPGFGAWVGVELSAENGRQVLVPPGFAHGYLTLVDACEVLYKVDAPWSPEHERTLAWDDPDLAIAWPDLGHPPILSERDAMAPVLASLGSPFRHTRGD